MQQWLYRVIRKAQISLFHFHKNLSRTSEWKTTSNTTFYYWIAPFYSLSGGFMPWIPAQPSRSSKMSCLLIKITSKRIFLRSFMARGVSFRVNFQPASASRPGSRLLQTTTSLLHYSYSKLLFLCISKQEQNVQGFIFMSFSEVKMLSMDFLLKQKVCWTNSLL